MAKSEAEAALVADLIAAGYPPETEHGFHPTRRWRFDVAYPGQMLAVEIDGRGRHQTAAGERGDCEKLNAALEMGWRVLRYPAGSVIPKKRRELIVQQIARVLCGVQSEEDCASTLTESLI